MAINPECAVWIPHIQILFFLATLSIMILVLRPGIEPRPLTVEAGNLNHWTARGVLLFFFLIRFF